ncbi:dihydrofolate reductase family protein [Corynebacterium halotolerans]|uniref:Riboflavin biosynthesis protein ribD n=1 Tax=Corynebacterium halotolerans YIM 70093 = DSM 44683 TaxID=1121362 RepID=M1NZ07_9CORY|nr:dihydrofolate reductase family protein [Corynebacterium halotolerans]AGF72750.1 Riboflavin biosynthesis protein ribD [Corynebacterium halotolerans YIM 70093 = DSM 44683]
MGRLVYSMITSLDGYVADRNGRFEWAQPDEEVLAVINEQAAEAGTYLYGRRMYEMMHVWETDPSVAAQSPESAEFARIWRAADKIVYSTTLDEVSTRRTRLERSFDPQAVRELKENSPADLTVDGPTLAAHALRHGLVDQVRPLVCPISIGGGLKFLPEFRIGLRLRGEHAFSVGLVQLHYDVTGVDS